MGPRRTQTPLTGLWVGPGTVASLCRCLERIMCLESLRSKRPSGLKGRGMKCGVWD